MKNWRASWNEHGIAEILLKHSILSCDSQYTLFFSTILYYYCLFCKFASKLSQPQKHN